MEYDARNRTIKIDKVVNKLDKFTLDFIRILKKHAEYVVVSGYVSILLGRSRASEDVDFLIPKLSSLNFNLLFKDLLKNGYECANTMDIIQAYEMLEEHAIRFFKKPFPIPNAEFKQISNDIHEYALKNKIEVIFGNNSMFISSLELQIAYKLSLMADGKIEELHSDKDFEDAKHIYEMFKDKLDIGTLMKFVVKFGVEDKFEVMKNA